MLLLHVRDACDAILGFTRAGEDAFREDLMCQHAVMRDIQVIGEAVKGVSEGLKEAHPEVPWREIAGMRDRIVHRYYEIDLDVVWLAVAGHIPALRRKVAAILDTLGPA